MKTAILIICACVFFSCSHPEPGKETGKKSDDSIEVLVTFALTNADPPYNEIDTAIVRKFGSEKEMNDWKASNAPMIKSFEIKNK